MSDDKNDIPLIGGGADRTSAVLCVDDEPVVTDSLRRLLSKHLKEAQVIEVAHGAAEALEVIEELREDGIELQAVVADYLMPDVKGDELLVRIHAEYPRVKKIMLTGQSDIGGVKRAINDADLYRFLEKPWSNEDLVLTLRGALAAYRQERDLELSNRALRDLNEALEVKVAERTAELEEKSRELEWLAITDRLTGLYNRAKIDETLEGELQRTARFQRPFGIILLDLDHFKGVNDTHGHQVGDQVLIEFAGLLKKHTRDTDAVGRWGGEEFLVICPETEELGVVKLAETLREAVERHAFPVVRSKTASFGVTAHQAGDNVANMIARADQALYDAKGAGRNRVVFAQELQP